MNMLLTIVEYGVKRFKHFRKQLILDYKKGKRHQHTNPHAMPNELKQKLLNVPHQRCRSIRVVTGKRSDKSRDKV